MNEISPHLDAEMSTHTRPSVESWPTERESAAEFDRRIDICMKNGIFERSFKEVRGFYLAHRPGREKKDARIDRILIPGAALKERGWTMAIGVELKKSGCDFGAAVSQAIDYTYCTWNVGHYWMYCERIFLWPFAMPQGPLQSVMLQNGVGTVSGTKYSQSEFNCLLTFRLERIQIEVHPDGQLSTAAPTKASNSKGSR